MDVGGKYAGTLSGTMNMMGNFAGGLAPLAVGYILRLDQPGLEHDSTSRPRSTSWERSAGCSSTR